MAGVFLSNLDVYVLAVCQPPSYSAVQDENLLSFLGEFCITGEVIILGDLYLPSLDWSSENVASWYVPPRELLFFDSFSLLGLCQGVHEGTLGDSNNILDLVLTTEADGVGDICVLEPFPKCHHCPVTFEYVVQFNDEDANEGASHLMWSRGNYARISASIIVVGWIMEFDGRSIIELCVPYRFPSDTD